ncbi:hypothetical protein D3C72_2403240 [compost metagenome]
MDASTRLARTGTAAPVMLRMARNSRTKPTPNTAPTATWVDDTGSPNAEAAITVRAAEEATQKARISLSLVICSPTV